MKKLNKKTDFEQQWQAAFRDASSAPPESVWDKIDADLARQEAGYFKRKATLFKLLAAASVVFALGVGTLSVFHFMKGEREESTERFISEASSPSGTTIITDKKAKKSSKIHEKGIDQLAINQNTGRVGSDQSTASSNERTEKSSKIHESQIGIAPRNHDAKNATLASSQISGSTKDYMSTKTLVGTNKENVDSWKNNDFLAQNMPSEVTQNQGVFSMPSISSLAPEVQDDAVSLQKIKMYKIPLIPAGTFKKKQKDNDEPRFLAALDFSTGMFDPNFRQAATGGGAFVNGDMMADARVESVNNQMASFNTANKDFLLVRNAGRETQPKITYSYGANIGFKISKRVLVQTGFAYRKANTSTTTSGYIENGNSTSRIPIIAAYQYQLEGLSIVKRIPETSLQNRYQFASIPLRLGYMLLEKEVSLTLMAGVTSEMLMGNQIYDTSNTLSSLSNNNDSGSSPYKNMYFNGSLGTVVGYEFADNYSVTLEPSYRFAVNSFTKSDFYLSSYPSSFMISFGVAYNFK